MLDIVPRHPAKKNHEFFMCSRLLFFAGLYNAIIRLWTAKLKKRGNQARGQRGRLDPHCKSRAAPLSGTRGRRLPAQNENKVLKRVVGHFLEQLLSNSLLDFWKEVAEYMCLRARAHLSSYIISVNFHNILFVLHCKKIWSTCKRLNHDRVAERVGDKGHH